MTAMRHGRPRLVDHLPHLGRRGSILLVLGLVWALVGVDLVSRAEPAAALDRAILYEVLPFWMRGALWLTTGMVAVGFAFVRTGRDRWGFLALGAMPLIRTVGIGYAAIVWLVSGGEYGYARGWIGALVWAGVLWMVWIVNGWPEARQRDGGDNNGGSPR